MPKSAALYYGGDIPWVELSLFDYAIVEADQAEQAPSDNNAYAYVSVGEVLPSRNYYPAIKKQWIVAKNKAWQADVLDQSQPALRQAFIKHVITPLWQKGYRRFFLDTLDSYRLVEDKPDAYYLEQQQGLVALIKAIQHKYPEVRFITNRGFELLTEIAPLVDAVAVESLYQGWDNAKQQYRTISEADRRWTLDRLNEAKALGLDVIAIDYAPVNARDEARNLAKKIAAKGVIPWVTNPAINTLGVSNTEVIPRKVLVLYGGSDEPHWELSSAIRFGLMPLQYLGLVPEVKHINDVYYDTPLTGRYAGIVTWLEEPDITSEQAEYFLFKQKQAGVPIAMLGYPAINLAGTYAENFGLVQATPLMAAARITRQSEYMGFEKPLSRLLALDVSFDVAPAKPWLELYSEKVRYRPVAITPWGGIATNPFVVSTVLPGVQISNSERWVLQPLAFLQAALKLPDMPIADVSTQNGLRQMFIHVDGDGFPSGAELPGKLRGEIAGEVLYQEILKPYPLPMTMSVIEAEVDVLYPKLRDELAATAKKIFALEHVEAATHTYSHPFFWYEAEAAPKAEYFEGELMHLLIPGYQFNLQREIVGSAKYIENNLLPKGKKVKMVLWSGDTTPTANALRVATEAGYYNMNGSDTVITESRPSWALIRGLGVNKGEQYQVFAPNQNEMLYTNGWQGPYGGFNRVIETYELTGSPRRFKPVNLYYHTYLVTKAAGLNSLKAIYQWIYSKNLFAIHASDYAQQVLAFNALAVAKQGDTWRIANPKGLKTLRLDQLPLPNLNNSQGLQGFAEQETGVYLHLTGKFSEWQQGSGQSQGPYLHLANGQLQGFVANNTSGTFSLEGHQPLRFSFANMGNCRLFANGQRLIPHTIKQGTHYFRSKKRELTNLRLQCSK